MNRRDFLKTITIFGSLFIGNRSFASNYPTTYKKTLANLFLDGGADFRHIFVPPFDSNESSYGYKYWTNRATSHNLTASNLSGLESRWNEYLKVTIDGVTFGVNPKCVWLKNQILEGNVAIINNVIGSSSRDHSHSLIVLESGSLDASSHDFARSGIGGRIAGSLGSNVLSLSRGVRLFCNGLDPNDILNHKNTNLIDSSDSRNMGLYEFDTKSLIDSGSNSWKWDTKGKMSRALSSYYQAKAQEIDSNSSIYKTIFQHEQKLREFGNLVNSRLVNIEQPKELLALYTDSKDWNEKYFYKQLLNLFDCFACSDMLNMQIASLEYNSWDSHKKQIDWIEPKLEAIFGESKGLDLLFKALEESMPKALDNLVITISSEFGRQLASNGDNGTDHGKGNSMLIIGKSIKGGIYGDMFPTSEIERFDTPSSDIDGKTSIIYPYKAVADWMGAKNIFDESLAILEKPLNLF